MSILVFCIIGTLTMGSLFCLSLNANGQYRVALVCYLILLAVEVFIPSWTLKTDAPIPYLRYSIACFIGLLVVQVTFVFVKEEVGCCPSSRGSLLFCSLWIPWWFLYS